MDPYEIMQTIGKIEYELSLQTKLPLVHQVFHVSMLMKCIGDFKSILPIEGLVVQENLSYKGSSGSNP